MKLESKMNFEFIKLDIPDVTLISSKRFSDDRGFFAEEYRKDIFEQKGLPKFVQDNISISSRGTLRGLHYQLAPKAQAKLVSCIRGYIIDVAVDIRPKSKTYGKYIKVELFGPGTMLYVPAGFAHGFLALEDDTIVSYKCSEYYSPGHDRNILWNDPDIGIEWELEQTTGFSKPLMSAKDTEAPLLKNADLE